jgi:hypothetical protein
MTKRGPRPVVFVCVAVNPEKPEDPVSIQIQATSQGEAASLFFEKTKLKAKNIHGPYRPKRAQVMENTRTLKFTNEQKRAIYDGWEVNAMILKEPENQAYLFFLKRVDGKKQQQPQGTIVVPVSDLRFT